MNGTWTIAELSELASGVLASGETRQSSGRVREAPNDRLIRWYATVGLVDPPLSRAGRIARYGRRHLLQLVAVKRRQAAGRSLAEIQAELVGATDDYLESVAMLPAAIVEPDGRRDTNSPERDEQFWRRRPASAPVTTAAVAGRPAESLLRAASAPAEPVEAVEAVEASALPGLVHGIRLAPGVLLVLDADMPGLPTADPGELRSAAEPLIKALARCGYTTAENSGENSGQEGNHR